MTVEYLASPTSTLSHSEMKLAVVLSSDCGPVLGISMDRMDSKTFHMVLDITSIIILTVIRNVKHSLAITTVYGMLISVHILSVKHHVGIIL